MVENKALALTALLAGLLLMTGCGGEKGPIREVSVNMGPGMIFEPATITGTQGEQLVVKLKNVDANDDHDFVVPSLGRKLLLKPGQSGQVIVPLTKAGTIDIVCTLPGHKDAGMVGKLIVNPK